MQTAINHKTGKTVPVMSGRVVSPVKGKPQHARNTARHSRCESGTLHKQKDLNDPLYLALRSDRDSWQKRKDKNGHNVKGEHIVSQLKAETQALLKEWGIDPSAPISRKCLIEPLVHKHVSVARSYHEPERGLKKVRPLREGITAGGKKARAGLGKIDPIEAQYVRPDGTVPLATPEVKRQAHYDSALSKEQLQFVTALLKCKVGYLPNDRPHRACLKAIAKDYFVKGSEGWGLVPGTRDKCTYKSADYVKAWQRICDSL